MTDLPSNVSYGKVTGRLLFANGDSNDPSDKPDSLPAVGTVTFTPNPEKLLNTSAVPPVTIWPKPVECTLDTTTGDLKDPAGNTGVYLIATDDPDLNPTNFTYRVKITLAGIAKPATFDMAVPANVTTDLTSATPLATSGGSIIIKGDKGDPGPEGPPGPTGSPPDASSTVRGIVELATATEASAGTDTGRAVTPAGVKAALASIANLPAGSTLTAQKATTWPARPTSRADITVIWKGADPSPAIVTSGTGGMLDGVDVRMVTP